MIAAASIAAIALAAGAFFASRDGLLGGGSRQGNGDGKSVLVFYANEKLDPGLQDCKRVFPVARAIPSTEAVGRAALEELLKGPSADERERGYFTSIRSRDVKVNSLSIRDGVAYADFSPELEKGAGGSCMVAAIRAEITETLKQFPTVKSAVISIEGRTEDILQP